MKIVVNTIPLLSPLTGIGKYTWQICSALQGVGHDNDYTFYYGYYSSRLFLGAQSHKGGKFVRFKDLLKNLPVFGRLFRCLKEAGAHFGKETYDLYFEPNYIPLNIRAKKIVTTVADFSIFEHPEWHDKELVAYFETHFWAKTEKADHVITISNFIRDTAIRVYGFSPDKVTTVCLGHDASVFRQLPAEQCQTVIERLRLPDRFLLCVGSIEPRKNLLRLLRAYSKLPAAVRGEYKLVLAGFRGWGNEEIMAMIESLAGDVIYTGYVSDSDLAVLYNQATLFIFPSLYEGFGLPPLEAMACGCPVVASHAASLPEVCGEAVVYVDPLDEKDIAAKIESSLNDEVLRQELRKKGLQRAKMFSWEKSARQHLDVFEAVMNESP